MRYPDIREVYHISVFNVRRVLNIRRKRLKKRETPDLSGCFTHRLLRRYGTQRDHRYARTADVFVSSSTDA